MAAIDAEQLTHELHRATQGLGGGVTRGLGGRGDEALDDQGVAEARPAHPPAVTDHRGGGLGVCIHLTKGGLCALTALGGEELVVPRGERQAHSA